MKQKKQLSDNLWNIKKEGILLCILLCNSISWAQDRVVVQGNTEAVSIKNNSVRLDFNLKNGLFSVAKANGEKVIADAFFRMGGRQSKDLCEERTWSEETFTDSIGKGEALILRVSFKEYSDILWKVRLYEDKSYYIFEMGIVNDAQLPDQLMSFYPLSSSAVYRGKDNLKNYRILDGNSGGSPTWVTLGIIASQRVWADTDSVTPEMLTYCGLRWYKNRVVINYDMDAKDPSDALPKEHSDGNRSMLTMTYVTGGRFVLGRSFLQLSKEQIHDLSRTFPYHTTAQSARPVDAFDSGVTIPRVYDFAVNPSWHQLTFYNCNITSDVQKNVIGIWPGKSLNEGGLELDPNQKYYVYDFWNDKFVALINGNDRFEQHLRPGETRMMAVHAKENNPQFIAANRHVMQGYIDLKDCKWNKEIKILKGTSNIVKDDTYKIIIATNGYKIAT